MLMLHFLGVAMGVGASFAFMFLGITARKMETTEAFKFRFNTLVLSRMGMIGLTLLIISGLYLITPYWSVIGSMPLLIVKLTLVLILGALLGIIGTRTKKAFKENDEALLKKIEPFSKLTFAISITIVILAVLIFM